MVYHACFTYKMGLMQLLEGTQMYIITPLVKYHRFLKDILQNIKKKQNRKLYEGLDKNMQGTPIPIQKGHPNTNVNISMLI